MVGRAHRQDEKPVATVQWKADTGPVALLRRTCATVLAARKVHKSVSKLKQEFRSNPSMDEQQKRERWEAVHRNNAKLVYNHIRRYRGFLAKVGQAASAKAGELPAPWVEELRGLQDQLPESSFAEVRSTVQEDLGCPLSKVFKTFEEKPIASASIAQAHVAYLRSTGAKVCVKVQHRGVGKLMNADLATVEFLVRYAAKKHPDAPDFTGFIGEWRRASREEVDFRMESENMARAREALGRAGVDVCVPEPVPGCCARHTLTMGFVDGWKITEVNRLPRGTDREDLARRLVDGFAALSFEEGLVHGDPHPGNIFIAPVGGKSGPGPLSFSPVMLDWGIVQRVDAAERTAIARWVLATMTQDSFMYLAALKDMGFVFGEDFESGDLQEWVHLSAWSLRDSIPSNAQLQFKEQLEKTQENDFASDMEDHTPRNKSPRTGQKIEDRRKLVKVPGTVLFFLRALEMLQQVCGTLDATVPFSQVLLRRALPLLRPSDSGGGAFAPTGAPARPLPAPRGCSELEYGIRTKLETLMEARRVLGAQVAVLLDTPCGVVRSSDVRTHSPRQGGWLCSVAAGQAGLTAGPLSEATALPLLGAGTAGVLATCLLAAMAGPTAAGQTVTLDTPVVRIWPEFSRRGKSPVTIGQLLRHQGGLGRPFPPDLTFKEFCHEIRFEESLAAAPYEVGGSVPAGSPEAVRESANKKKASSSSKARATPSIPPATPCYVQGEVLAALLRRMEGAKSAKEAVRLCLKPLGLHEDIFYGGSAPEERLARLGRQPMESLPLATAFEWLEEREADRERRHAIESGAGRNKWRTYRDLKTRLPACGDPLLLNRDVVRAGTVPLSGRGLRGTAKALCRLYGSNSIREDILKQSLQDTTEFVVDSAEEWHEFGRCKRVGAGWQIFPFKRNSDGEEVVGYGHVDGHTGSLALRLPGATVAILLSSIDHDARDVGYDLLSIVADHLGFTLGWSLEVPAGLPAKPHWPREPGNGTLVGKEEEYKQTIAHLQDKLSQLQSEMDAKQGSDDPTASPELALVGKWVSTEIEGLDTLLDVFDVPVMARVVARRMRRKLNLDIRGHQIFLETTISVAGRTIEQNQHNFEVGQMFDGEEQLFGCFKASAAWAEAKEDGGSMALVIEKRFDVGGQQVLLVERLVADAEGQRLVREVQIGSETLMRGGQLADIPEQGPAAFPVPGTVTVHYEDAHCRMTFDRPGRRRASQTGTSGAALCGARSEGTFDDLTTIGGSASSSCVSSTCFAGGMCVAGTATLLGAALLGAARLTLGFLGKACESGCSVGSQSRLNEASAALADAGLASRCSSEADHSRCSSVGSRTPAAGRGAAGRCGSDRGSRGVRGDDPRLATDADNSTLQAMSTAASTRYPSPRTESKIERERLLLENLTKEWKAGRITPGSRGEFSEVAPTPSVQGHARDAGANSGDSNREAGILQLLMQQQMMQQQLMNQLVTQQALFPPQSSSADQLCVQQQLAVAQRQLAEQAVAQQELIAIEQNDFVNLMQGLGGPIPSVGSRTQLPLLPPQTALRGGANKSPRSQTRRVPNVSSVDETQRSALTDLAQWPPPASGRTSRVSAGQRQDDHVHPVQLKEALYNAFGGGDQPCRRGCTSKGDSANSASESGLGHEQESHADTNFSANRSACGPSRQ
eukprot:TRINITY_DN15323_c0_g1_i1.p1 TRINITY_DN15323_c0_g1~~TRINITY_DN15323_c0_g1_i1.p1  ORF type:complete len:1652 (+),score=335.63 TRINITY_DN15323_c0_g1_i1:50-5005(+)